MRRADAWEGSRVRFLYLDSSRPATRLQEHRAYPELFAVVGNSVPDLRGLFLRGHGGNSAALGVQQGDAIRNLTGSLYMIGLRGTAPNGSFRFAENWPMYQESDSWSSSWREGTLNFNAAQQVPTAEENRPVNQAVRYLIRARP